MPTTHLGRTGVEVSRLTLGAMMFGAWGNTDHEDSYRIIDRALDAGINVIDTADVYSAGESEVIVGEALKRNGRRDDTIVATKFFNGTETNKRGGSRRWIMRAVEDSLRRLQTDHIDLYQMHRQDEHADVEETLAALDDLVRQGKVRYIGSSTYQPSRIVEAQWAAQRRNTVRFVTEQPPYSILARGIETEVLATTQRYGMGTLTWSPLAGGWLSGRYRKGSEVPTSTRSSRLPARYDLSIPGNRAKLDAAEELAQLADEIGIPLVQLAIAFVLRHPGVSTAIIGPRTMEHLESQLPAATLALDDATLDRIDEIVPPGITLSAGDTGYLSPGLAVAARRR